MKVAQILPTMRRAGAESVVATLSVELAKLETEVDLVIAGGSFEYEEELNDSKVAVHQLQAFERRVPFYGFHTRTMLRRGMRQFLQSRTPDVVHCHLPHSLIFFGGVLGAEHKHVFYTVHGQDSIPSPVSSLRDRIRRNAFHQAIRACAPHILAVSQCVADYAREELAKVYGRAVDVYVQPNPVDLGYWSPGEADRQRLSPDSLILMVGTLYNLKRVVDGVEALAVLRSRGVIYRLAIIGDGPDRTMLEALVERRGLKDVVTFVGVTGQVKEYMHRSSCMWLLSEREGLPMVALEAMASGLPVIATNAPGTTEVVKHEANGLLVPMHSPQSVANATERLKGDLVLYKRLVDGGRATVRRYKSAEIAKQVLSLYANVTR